MNVMRLIRFAGWSGLTAMLCFASAGGVSAQAYPDRPVRLVVQSVPGGTSDQMARMITSELETKLGRNVIVDNRAGASGIIATEIVARAQPDGYTLLHTTAAFVTNSALNRKLPYDVQKDFSPISNVALGTGYLLVVNPSVRANSVQELVALAKSGTLAYGSPGIGNILHLVSEMFNSSAGTRILHVPYKSSGLVINGLVSGEIKIAFATPVVSLPQIKNGKLRALAFTGSARMPSMPELPTVAESGLPDFVVNGGWQGWVAPVRVPPKIIETLHRNLHEITHGARMRTYLVESGYQPLGNDPREFRAFIASELDRYKKIVQLANIRLE
ncbi:MAG: tripartite tricarboxylate transporter substrate binding protein [Burkholderiales bacterium]|nr:tripartite tricarboxylate transporter substrate binding protein [Burkholderiales bacterium]MCW5603009.1 tripartite tricarboxylate transporter substrate binding protein [Burkholderiales bacterium]